MQEVLSGQYDGWTDPRTWSFGSLERRGIRSEAIRSFVLSFGMSLADIEVPAESLYSENRKLLDPVTPRRAFVTDPISLDIQSFPSGFGSVQLANHPDHNELGHRILRLTGGRLYIPSKDVLINLGKEIRLKDLFNVQLATEVRSDRSIRATFTSQSNKPIPRIQWVPTEGAIEATILMPDGSTVTGVGEESLKKASLGQMFQFERFGFVKLDLTESPSLMRFAFAHS